MEEVYFYCECHVVNIKVDKEQTFNRNGVVRKGILHGTDNIKRMNAQIREEGYKPEEFIM